MPFPSPFGMSADQGIIDTSLTLHRLRPLSTPQVTVPLRQSCWIGLQLRVVAVQLRARATKGLAGCTYDGMHNCKQKLEAPMDNCDCGVTEVRAAIGLLKVPGS